MLTADKITCLTLAAQCAPHKGDTAAITKAAQAFVDFVDGAGVIAAYTVRPCGLEPADTVHLYRSTDGSWKVNHLGRDGSPWAMKQVAPYSAWHARHPTGRNDVLVKVPV